MYIADEAIMQQYTNEMILLKKMNKEYIEICEGQEYNTGREYSIPVSYTHLTLPTILRV